MECSRICRLTLALQTSPVYACAADQDVKHDSKDNLTPDPLTGLVEHGTISDDGCLIQLDTLVMPGTSNRQFLRMEKVPTCSADDLARGISEYVND